MADTVRSKPQGFNSVSAYLVVPNSIEALAFYEKAFGAKTRNRLPGPQSNVTLHAEMQIGDSVIMMTDENPQSGAKSAATLGGSPVSLHLFVEDADASYQRAVDAGCAPTTPLEDMFWGDRYGKVRDPYGIEWALASRRENLTAEQIRERAETFFTNMGGAP